MAPEEIVEGNRLIAEFMSERIAETDFYDGRGYVKTFLNPTGAPYEFNELEFHFNWNWLMPVVKKIEEKRVYAEEPMNDYVLNELLKLDISSLWDSVVNFIKSWNTSKKE